MVVDGPIDNVDFITIPASSTDTTDEKENMGEESNEEEGDEEMDKPNEPDDSSTQKKQYIYYVSNGKVIMVNKDDPEDKQDLSRTGAAKYIMDGKRGVLFYVMFNRNIVKEDIGKGGSPNFIVTGIGAVGDMIFDYENNVIYFTDTVKGQIEKYDVNAELREVLYRNLREPSNLSLSDGYVSPSLKFWVI
jgi:hypothetical protein